MAVGENLVRLDPQPGYKFRKWKDDANKKIEEASKEFTARNYQLEMLEAAKRGTFKLLIVLSIYC